MSSPWLKSIRANERPSILALLAPLAWLSVFGTALYFVVKARGDPAGIGILGVLVLIGLAWFCWQGIVFGARVQSGTARLVLQESVPSIGGRIKALVQLPGSAAHASHVAVELVCVRDLMRNSRGDRDAPNAFSPGTVWSAKLDAPVRLEAGAAVAALEFEIPATCLPSGKWDSGRDDSEEHDMSWQVWVSSGAARNLVKHHFDLEVLRPRAPQAAQTPIDWLRDVGAYALIAANLIPVYMVLKGRADVAAVAYFYWTENLAIVFFMVLRVLFAVRGRFEEKSGSVLGMAAWFVAASTFLGAVMLEFLVKPPRGWDQLSQEQFDRGDSWIAHFVRQIYGMIGGHLIETGMVFAVLAMVASHGVGFIQNYIRNGEYLRARVNREMRVLVNRAVVTFGAIFVLAPLGLLGPPAFIVAGVVLLKTGIEVWRYARERRAVAAGVS